MALNKSDILAQINTLLADFSNILPSEHREALTDLVDKAYDENIDGVSLVGTDLIFTRDSGVGTPIAVDLSGLGGGGGEANTSSTSGTGASLTLTKVGSDLPFRGIKGVGASISTDADSLTITAASVAQGTLADTAIQAADLATVATSGSYSDLTNKPTIPPTAPIDSVNGETGVVVLDGTEIELIESGGVSVTQAITDLSNTSLQDVTDNGNLTTNPIIAPSINGAAITASGSGGSLYLDDAGNYTAPPSGSGGEINTASNVGSGEGVFKQKNNSDLQFKSFESSGSALSVSSDANNITYTLNDSAFATAAQGTKADTALQTAAIGTTVQAHSATLDATTASFTTATEAQIISNVVSVNDLSANKADKNPTIRTVTGTTDTLVLTDDDKYLRCTNAAAVTETVPPNSSVAFNVGSVITIRQAGAGQVTLAEGVGVTLNGNLKTAEQHASIQIMKVDTNVWDVIGGVA